MKRFLAQDGGRELLHDDLLLLEGEARTSLLALCAAAGVNAFVVQGCRVTTAGGVVRVGAGIVYLSGQLLRLQATDGLAFPIEIVSGTNVLSEDRRYEDGSIHAGWGETFAVARAATNVPTGKVEIVDVSGGLTYAEAMANRARKIGVVEFIDATPAAGEYDVSGAGLGRNRGWQLLAGAAGRFPVMYDPNDPTYAVGATGGQATVNLSTAQMPIHRHDVINAATGNVVGDVLQNLTGSNLNAPLPTVPSGSVWGGGPVTTRSVGESQAHENRPPFYALLARRWQGA